MVYAAAVLLLAVVVIVVGAAVELARTVRARRAASALGQGEAVQAVLDELDPRPWLVWLGAAALSVLAPGLVWSTSLTGSEFGLAVVVLGLAGERGQFLAHLDHTEPRRAGWTALVAVATVIGGLVVGSS